VVAPYHRGIADFQISICSLSHRFGGKNTLRKKRILAVTGIRSEYDILFPVLGAIRENPAFDLSLAVSGAHNSDWHGLTLKKIEEDGFFIADKIDNLFMTNRNTQRPKGLGVLLYALSQTVERINPDVLLVIGDREESIATALIGNYMGILVAHIGGGDTACGNADDPVRFAVSKLSHIHLTMAKRHADNLKKIGEESFRIFNVGNPSLDNIRKTRQIPLKKLSRLIDFDISNRKFVVLIQHPLSSEVEEANAQMQTTLTALGAFCKKFDFKVVATYPNTDPGSRDIVMAIRQYDNSPYMKFYKSLSRDLFINLMRNTKALVGNSSMGILEAPFYRLPVINVGNRQKGRYHTEHVKFISHNVTAINKCLIKSCFDERYRDYIRRLTNPFGSGTSAEKIRDIILSLNLDDKKWYIKKKLC